MMEGKKRRLAWRCKDTQQQRDKAEIYNSKSWKQLRARKLAEFPLCEMCIAEGQAKGIKRGYLTRARCVHHIVPIETASTKGDMWRLALDWGNLQSLCRRHHSEVHNDAGYHTKEAVQERKQSAFERWLERQHTPPSTAK